MGKTNFSNFGGLQKILNKTEFHIIFLAIVLWNKMKVFARRNKIMFKAPVIF